MCEISQILEMPPDILGRENSDKSHRFLKCPRMCWDGTGNGG
jgi:hypothetical protein